jgi:hypothetical protein
MTLFFFNLRKLGDTPKLIARCTIVGERQGFSSRERQFDDADAARQALEAAGVESFGWSTFSDEHTMTRGQSLK